MSRAIRSRSAGVAQVRRDGAPAGARQARGEVERQRLDQRRHEAEHEVLCIKARTRNTAHRSEGPLRRAAVGA
jgi:hypothetical protein